MSDFTIGTSSRMRHEATLAGRVAGSTLKSIGVAAPPRTTRGCRAISFELTPHLSNAWSGAGAATRSKGVARPRGGAPPAIPRRTCHPTPIHPENARISGRHEEQYVAQCVACTALTLAVRQYITNLSQPALFCLSICGSLVTSYIWSKLLHLRKWIEVLCSI